MSSISDFWKSHTNKQAGKNTENIMEETGLDRVKRMFRKTDYGFVSPEMNYFITCATTSVTISAAFGALFHANQAKVDHLRKNVATQFESQHLARRRLIDTMTLSAIKGGAKYALKYGSFSSLYLLSTMTAANYNNKITIWEHIGSGALIGSLFRINYGLKGMLAAGSTGAVLGTFAGGILLFSMWLSNATFEDVRNWNREIYFESRSKRYEVSREDLLKDKHEKR